MPPLKVEYAKSGRSVCSLKECSKAIDKGCVRIGTGAMMPGVDELRYKWRHLCCFTKRQLASVSSVDGISGFEDLTPDDQMLVRKMITGALIGDASAMSPSPTFVTTSPTSSPKKKARAEESGAPSVSEAFQPPAVATAETALPIGPDGRRMCPHGQLCFRLDAAHFAHCSHNTGIHAA